MASGPPSEGVLARLVLASRLELLAARLAWQCSPLLFSAILALTGGQAVLGLLQLAALRLAINQASLDVGLPGQNDSLPVPLPLGAWVAITGVLLAANQLSQPLTATLQAIMGDRLSGLTTERLIAAVNRWPGIGRFEDPDMADDLDRAYGRAALGGFEVLIHLTGVLAQMSTVVGLGAILVRLNPFAPAALLVATIPYMASEWAHQSATWQHLYRRTPEARRAQYTRDLTLTPAEAKEVRLYQLGPFLRSRYDELFALTTGALERLRRKLAGWVAAAGALSGAAAGAVYVYVVWRIARGELSLGDLALYGGAATMLQSALLSMAGAIGHVPFVFAFLPSLYRVLGATPDLRSPAAPRPAPRPIREGFAFEHVSFRYPASDGLETREVLRDVSFRLAPGECVALVGQNGAGKTTVIKLLLRLYDPTGGRILLDGVDLREYDVADLRRQASAIFQDFVRYELTVGENIAIGDADVFSLETRAMEAVRRAGAADLISGLPDGLQTQLGRWFGGRELSGGEWQKIALARALARDAQLLVLDEPTAALDAQTEHEVYRRFHELTEGRTTVLISHRFSTVRMADRILHLVDGAVEEEGTHHELIARAGAYARLYQLQASQYGDGPHGGARHGDGPSGGR